MYFSIPPFPMLNSLFIHFSSISQILSHKGKEKMHEEDPMVPSVHDLDKTPLIDTQYKIDETQCGFDLYELHNWEKQK